MKQSGNGGRKFVRNLDSYEATVSHFASLALAFNGTVDGPTLGAAIKELQQKYPITRCTIQDVAGTKSLYHQDRHCIDFFIVDGGDSELLEEADRQLAESDERKALIRFTLICGDHSGYILFVFSHSVFDGGSLLPVIADLWSIYVKLSNGSAPSVDPKRPFPKSPYALLEERNLGHLIQRTSLDPTAAIEESTAAIEEQEVAVDLRTWKTVLDDAETSKFVNFCKDHSLTVTSVISAISLLSQYKLSTARNSGLMRFYTIADLRNRVSPCVDPEESTNFIGWHTAEYYVSASSDLIVIASELKTQLRHGLDKLENLKVVNQRYLPTAIDTSLEEHLASATLSNVKEILLDAPKHHKASIIGFGIVDREHPTGLAVSTKAPINLVSKMQKYPSYVAATTDGKLSIWCHAPCVEGLDSFFDRDTFKELEDKFVEIIFGEVIGMGTRV